MTTMQIDRAVIEQALEALEAGLDVNPILAGEAEEALRAALAQRDEPEAYGYASRLAVAIWEKHYKDTAPQWKLLDDLMGVLTQIDNMTSGLTRLAKQDEPEPMPPEQRQRWEELAAMPQQAEPAQDRHRACPTHCCPVHGCKYGHDDCPVAAGAVQPVYPRNNGCESCADDALAQQDEPAREWVSMDEYKRLQGLVTSQGIRLMEYESKQPQQAEPVQHYASIPGTNVRVRLQAEPVEPVATLIAQRDALLEALRMFVSCAIPVSTKIDERGYGWTQAYLDQALPKARAAIKAVEETK